MGFELWTTGVGSDLMGFELWPTGIGSDQPTNLVPRSELRT